MVKISVGGYDDGEGPSNRNQKRRREEEEDEEEPNSRRSFEIVDRSIELQEREDHHPAPPNRATPNGSASNETRVRSIPIFVSDPDVLDCCICYEPLSAPVFQVNFPSRPFFFIRILPFALSILHLFWFFFGDCMWVFFSFVCLVN